jgi:glycosyltransferase domain-containing protein
MINKLTIIIPTYNRQKIVLRAINYWSQLGATVHIFDGSVNPIKNIENLKINKNIFYHHNPISYIERMQLAIKYVNTEYCALCGDDEFYLESGINAVIQKLDQNLELIACAGRPVGFSYLSKKLKLKNVYIEQKRYSVSHEDYTERMIFHMRNYTPSTIYSIIRKNNWINAMQVATTKDYPVHAMFELQFEMMIALQGRSMVINNLYWLRNFDIKGIRNTPDLFLSSENNFKSWWIEKNNIKEKEILIDTMIKSIHHFDQKSNKELKKIIYKSFDAYYEFDVEFFGIKKKINRGIIKIFGLNRWIIYEKYVEKNFTKEFKILINNLKKIEELLNNYEKK